MLRVLPIRRAATLALLMGVAFGVAGPPIAAAAPTLAQEEQQGEGIAKSLQSGERHCSDLSADDFELIGEDQEQLPLVAFRFAGERDYDEFDLSWQLSAERGWMLPAYTMPPNAEDVKVLRALVKQTLSREQIDHLAEDIQQACATLEKKGGAHPAERAKMKIGPGH